MKQNPRFTMLALSSALAFLAGSVIAQKAENATAKVIRLKGAARFSTGNFIWQPIKLGDAFPPGSVIQTSAEPDSYVDLALGDGKAPVLQPMVYRPSIPNSFAPSTTTFRPASEQNVIRLWGDGALVLDKLNTIPTGERAVTETELDLKRGRLTGNVKKLATASQYEIKFNNGIAGVRGTVFDIQAVGIIKVYLGSMVVAWVNPQTQKVTTQTVLGGQAYDVATGQVSLLSIESMNDLGQVSSALLVPEPFTSTTTLALDRTAIGMSPVGANSAGLPHIGQPIPPPFGGGVVMTSQHPPPPISGITLEASRFGSGAGFGPPPIELKPGGPGTY